ncbi:MAG: DUF5519 family protein [Balneolaceae bacterium]|nr:DUF5519 family protein [Balneolaceae bacterium]
MNKQKTASKQITDEVTSWVGVSAGQEKRDEFSFKVEGREIGHLHGDRVAHFYFPREVGVKLREKGRVGPHPVNLDSPKLALLTIRDQSDVEEVITLMRSN